MLFLILKTKLTMHVRYLVLFAQWIWKTCITDAATCLFEFQNLNGFENVLFEIALFLNVFLNM